MSRKINREIMDRIYGYLVDQWYEFNRKPIKRSLSEIGEAIKIGHIDSTMVRFYIKKLEEEGKIQILSSGILGRNSANAYKIIEENRVNEGIKEEVEEEIKEIVEIKEDTKGEIKNFNEEAINQVKEITSGIKGIEKRLERLVVDSNKFHYLMHSLRQLESMGTMINGDQIFVIPANYNLKEIIECYQNKNKENNNYQNSNGQISSINEKRSDLH